MAGDGTDLAPKGVGSAILLYLIAAALAGLAIIIAVWFFVARAAPEAAPDRGGPIEAAEPPDLD
jgi:uncharacterized membrane protein